jgi:hypothetical protein
MVFRVTGGTLALTSRFGLDIPDLTQNRIDAELGAFGDYERNCRGKLEDCKQRLEWSVERYAKFHEMLPPPPVLLDIKQTDGGSLFIGIAMIIVGMLGVYWTSPWVQSEVWLVRDGWMYNMDFPSKQPVTPGVNIVIENGNSWVRSGHWHAGFFNAGFYPDWAWPWWILCFVFIAIILGGAPLVIEYLNAVKANGDRPGENARRTKAYERALAAAMKDAERKKEAEDYRLHESIRKLIGIIESVREKADSIRVQYAERVRKSQANRY